LSEKGSKRCAGHKRRLARDEKRRSGGDERRRNGNDFVSQRSRRGKEEWQRSRRND
jgi:hypothetical protein